MCILCLEPSLFYFASFTLNFSKRSAVLSVLVATGHEIRLFMCNGLLLGCALWLVLCEYALMRDR